MRQISTIQDWTVTDFESVKDNNLQPFETHIGEKALELCLQNNKRPKL